MQQTAQPSPEIKQDKSRVLSGIFGFDTFRPGQEEVIDCLLDGDNALVVMPTGAGKSLCFQVPALARGGLSVVVSPLVALMQDQVTALRLAGVAAKTINSSRSREQNVEAWRSVQAGECRLLYMAPERLMTERMITALQRIPLSFLIVDEAHCISQWGPSFRPEYADLKRLGELFPGVPLAAFTATADEMTRAEIVEKLFAGQARSFIAGFDRPNIRLSVEMKRDLKRQALSFVKAQDGAPGIVYCLSRAKTERTAEYLNANGISALPYHAGMDKRLRDENQDRFMTEDGMVMVATIAFGMGIDKPDLRFVLHTDLPGNIEAYYQELGRAGRDGQPAQAHMLYGLDDIRMRRMFIEEDEGAEDRKRRDHKRLDALLGYCESPVCRRGALLAYFGETLDNCGNCDVCLDPMETADGTEAGQKVLSAVSRTGQIFGAAHIIDVLSGSLTEKVEKFSHDALPTFGVGGEFSKAEWRSLIRQLVAGGFLAIDIEGHGGLRLGEKGGALLKGEVDFTYRPDRVRPRAGKEKKKTATAATATRVIEDLSAPDAQLLTRLKALRSDLAKQKGVPAFVIFHDKSLIDMARRRPASQADFAHVHGVGEAKLEAFSEAFLSVISEVGE